MPRERKQSLKTRPPGKTSAVTLPKPWPRFKVNQDGTLEYSCSASIYAANKDELGYPSYRAGMPSLPERPSGEVDVQRAFAQETFILFMFSEAKEHLLKFHEDVFPKFEVLAEDPGALYRKLGREFWCGGSLRLCWEDLERRLPELEELRAAILAWLDGRDLWKGWFVSFCLDLLSDRLAGDLIAVPDPGELYYQIVSYHDGRRFEDDEDARLESSQSWDKLELPAMVFNCVSDQTFDQVKRRVLERVEAVLEEWRSEFQALELRRKDDIGLKKKTLDHYRWIVRRVWNREDYGRIAEVESARLSSPGKTVDSPNEEAIKRGCKGVAKYLEIDPDKGK